MEQAGLREMLVFPLVTVWTGMGLQAYSRAIAAGGYPTTLIMLPPCSLRLVIYVEFVCVLKSFTLLSLGDYHKILIKIKKEKYPIERLLKYDQRIIIQGEETYEGK